MTLAESPRSYGVDDITPGEAQKNLATPDIEDQEQLNQMVDTLNLKCLDYFGLHDAVVESRDLKDGTTYFYKTNGNFEDPAGNDPHPFDHQFRIPVVTALPNGSKEIYYKVLTISRRVAADRNGHATFTTTNNGNSTEFGTKAVRLIYDALTDRFPGFPVEEIDLTEPKHQLT